MLHEKESMKFTEVVFVTVSDSGTEGEYMNADADLKCVVKSAADETGDVVDVAEYKLVRTFKAKVNEVVEEA